MKITNTKLSSLQADNFYRLDEKFYITFNINQWKLFKNSNNNIKFKYILAQDNKIFNYEDNEEYYGVPTGASYINKNGQIINYDIVTKEKHPGRIKYKISNDNIIISSLRLARSPATIFEKINTNKYIFSNGFYILKAKENWNNRFLMYMLRIPQLKNLLDNNIYRGIGISSYKIDDLLKIEIPNISLEKQKKFLEKIKDKENIIYDLYKRQIKTNQIINKVFSKEFEYDENLINEVRKGMTYGTQSSTNSELNTFNCTISKLDSDNLRLSVRANSNIFKRVEKILKHNDCIQIKDVIKEPIHNGAKPVYTENVDIPVIKTTYLTNNGVDTSSITEFTTMENYEKYTDAQLKNKDILICNIGKCSCGKIDIKEDDIDSFGANEVTIIRTDNGKYNPKFLLYVLRSIFGIYQIEKAYTGTTNQIHLNPKDVEDFIIPNISLDLQEKIVKEIDEKIKEQNEIENQIIEEQEKIEKILLEIIK